MIKKTPLYELHQAAKAKMVPFAGWSMPVSYASGIIAEHQMVRSRAGLFDVSHMGEIDIKGSDARRFLDSLTPGPVSRLEAGRAQYSFLCDAEGGVIDDIIIYCLAADHYLLCVNAANIDADWAWVREQAKTFSVELDNASDRYALLALQGPRAREFLHATAFAGLGTDTIKRFAWRAVPWQGSSLLVARTGYTGEDGFEFFCPPDLAPGLWARLLEDGKAWGVGPAGLGARDSLRLEAALPLYGHELDRTHSPVESDLGRFIDWDKSAYIGRERILKDRAEGGKERLVAITVADGGIPRADYPVGQGEQVIGSVTSGGFSPTLEKGVALAFVKSEFAQIGLDIWVEIRKKRVQAVISKKPFYKPHSN